MPALDLKARVQPAKRQKVNLRLWVTGASGSGKTATAMKLAHYLSGGTDTEAGNFIVIDTENNSALLYACANGEPVDPNRLHFQFDHVNLGVNEVSPAAMVSVIKQAGELGYKAIVIDSSTHEWKDVLDKKNEKDKQGGNSFVNWADFTKEHDKFVDQIQRPPCHIIVTARAKEEYAVTEDRKVKKMGLQPIQRDTMPYEFDINILMVNEGDPVAIIQKARSLDLSGRTFAKPGKELADALITWAQTGEEPGMTRDAFTHRLMSEYNVSEAQIGAAMKILKLSKPSGAYDAAYEAIREAIENGQIPS